MIQFGGILLHMFTFFKRKTKKSIRHVDGVFFDQRRRVVAIKKKTVTLEMKRSSLRSLWVFTISCVAIISAGLFIFGSAFRIHAETLLYPQTCLGGWSHSEKAAGTPEVMGHTPEDYTDDNSASVSNALAQIFCGGFSGDIPANTSPTKIIVRFSWAVKEVVPPASPIIIYSEDYASSTIKIIDVPVDTPAQLEIPVSAEQTSPSTPEESPTAPVPQDAPPDTSTSPAPDTSPPSEAPPLPETPSPEPVSFLQWFVQPQRAFAQEVATTSAENALLEVLYTFDGTTWETLGTATRDTLSSAVFEIPLTATSSWKDLSQLQVSVHSLSNFDTATTLYLDGMILSVEYDKIEVKPEVPQGDPDPKSFHVSVSPHGGTRLHGVVTDDGTGQQTIQFKGVPGTGFKVFNLADSSFGLTSSFGDDPMTMLTSNFGNGDFIMIDTSDNGGCSNLGIDECREAAGYIDEVAFSITSADVAPASSAGATLSP